jgi:hypothetical protein
MTSQIEPTTQDISNIEQRLKQTSLAEPEKNLLNGLLAMTKQNQVSDSGPNAAWVYIWESPV